jgi:hypothetical protein
LVIVVGHACPVLVHTDDGGINHLHRRVMTGSRRIHDPVPEKAAVVEVPVAKGPVVRELPLPEK